MAVNLNEVVAVEPGKHHDYPRGTVLCDGTDTGIIIEFGMVGLDQSRTEWLLVWVRNLVAKDIPQGEDNPLRLYRCVPFQHCPYTLRVINFA